MMDSRDMTIWAWTEVAWAKAGVRKRVGRLVGRVGVGVGVDVVNGDDDADGVSCRMTCLLAEASGA